jgi:cell division protein FtsN
MPDLNLIDEGGIEETPSPSTPASSKRSGKSVGGGGMNKVLIGVLVLLILGTAGFYLYKKNKLPFLKKKKAVVTQLQEEPLQEASPNLADQQANVQQVIPTQDTANVPLLETTPLGGDATKKAEAKEEKKGDKGSLEQAPMKKLTEMQGSFTIQVSAFREQKQADEIVARLEEAGYPAFVETIPMKGVNWYTVRIGHYPSRTDAKKAVGDFALELRSNYWIDRVRSK